MPLTGVVYRRLRSKPSSRHERIPRLFHIWFGRAIIVTGIVNGGLGIRLAGVTRRWLIPYVILSVFFSLLWLASSIYKAVTDKKRRASQQAVDLDGSGHLQTNDREPGSIQLQANIRRPDTATTAVESQDDADKYPESANEWLDPNPPSQPFFTSEYPSPVRIFPPTGFNFSLPPPDLALPPPAAAQDIQQQSTEAESSQIPVAADGHDDEPKKKLKWHEMWGMPPPKPRNDTSRRRQTPTHENQPPNAEAESSQAGSAIGATDAGGGRKLRASEIWRLPPAFRSRDNERGRSVERGNGTKRDRDGSSNAGSSSEVQRKESTSKRG